MKTEYLEFPGVKFICEICGKDHRITVVVGSDGTVKDNIIQLCRELKKKPYFQRVSHEPIDGMHYLHMRAQDAKEVLVKGEEDRAGLEVLMAKLRKAYEFLSEVYLENVGPEKRRDIMIASSEFVGPEFENLANWQKLQLAIESVWGNG